MSEELERTEEERTEKEAPEKEIAEKLDRLQKSFDEKIRTDEYKNKLFDQLHEELKHYQDDIISEMTNPIVLELIGVIEQIEKQAAGYPEAEEEGMYERLRKNYLEAAEDLRDILYGQDVESYSVEGDFPDTKRQKIVKTVLTPQKELDNTIEKRLSPGYIKNNRIIKYERITIYKYREEKENE